MLRSASWQLACVDCAAARHSVRRQHCSVCSVQCAQTALQLAAMRSQHVRNLLIILPNQCQQSLAKVGLLLVADPPAGQAMTMTMFQR
jgi:hypothetical protein